MEKQTNILTPIAIIIAGALIASAVLFTQEKEPVDTTPKNTINAAEITNEDHILGDRNASIKIVEYSDTECPFCKRFHGFLHEIVEGENKIDDIAWVYRHFPIESLHKKAFRQAEATECVAKLSGKETFWSYLDRIYEETPSNDGLLDEQLYEFAADLNIPAEEFAACLESGEMTEKIAASVEEAQDAGARGTPYSVLFLDEKLTDEKITIIKELDLQISQNHPTRRILQVDEKDKNKISMSGALPPDLIAKIVSIVRE